MTKLQFLFFLILPAILAAEPWIVQNGQPNAEIVISENPPRLVKLAAKEIQVHIEKISGARLPIVTDIETKPDERVRLYVGRSEATDRLGINDTGLHYGAYRLVSGPGYLVFLGHDADFTPIEPYSHNRNDQARAEQDWDSLTTGKTDSAWGFPMSSTFRAFNRTTETWAHDQGGSLQAVYGFLRQLGVRWYWPGELGEVVPKLESIALPQIDETVHPDFPVRHFIGPSWQNAPEEAILWARRIGLNSGYARLGLGPKTHGFSRVHARPEMQKAHPDFYAEIGGERDVKTRGTGHACWSSAGLQREAVAYARTMFDHYGEPTLQLSPQDGLRMCQCEDCAKLTPSDAVWGFLDRVARETFQTHPDHHLVGAAYTSYRELPAAIDELSPNIVVRLNNVGRPNFREAEHWQWYRDLAEGWRKKAASGQLIRVENNYYDTVIHPRSIARDLKAMKGISLGEMNEVNREYVAGRKGQTWGRPGTNHLNLYINSRFLWDADQNVEAVLTEYYEAFYGPAAEAMQRAFDYAEAHYATDGRARLELPERVRLLELLHQAREAAPADSVFAQRIEFIISEFDALEDLKRTLATEKKRGNVPRFEYWNMTSGKWDEARASAKIDGQLEESFWNLRGKLSGGEPGATRFQILHADDALWVGIRCRGSVEEDATAANLDDDSILDGNRVEILLETDANAFYRIAVSPTGAIYDCDMAKGNTNGKRWNSNAEIAVHREADAWSIEARIPLVPESEGEGDPLHHILFRRPPKTLWPWYFNIVRFEANEVTGFIPVNAENVHDRLSFGELSRK